MFELFLTIVVSGLILEVSFFGISYIYSKLVMKEFANMAFDIGEEAGRKVMETFKIE